MADDLERRREIFRDWLDSEELLHLAELAEAEASRTKDVEGATAVLETACALRRIAGSAMRSSTIGPRGWPVVMVEVQGVGKHMRREPPKENNRG